MKIIRLTTAGVLVISALLLLITPAMASVQATYGFCNITHNSAIDPAIGEFQLSVDVEDVANTNQVLFTFHNEGPDAASITDVYFDDGTLFGIAAIIEGVGTQFSQPATPGDLPGGNTIVPPFVTSRNFSADSDAPVMVNGVNPGESVGILFDLQTGKTVADVVAALNTTPTGGENDPSLRIGIHVQGFADGNSESFVNCKRTAITLASFGAKASGSTVALEWVTGTEVNNAGFNLYRATSLDGPRTKVNPYLVVASGEGASGASYKYLDAPGYGSFFYWLEDVDYSGMTTLHGPVMVVLSPAFRRPMYQPVLPVLPK